MLVSDLKVIGNRFYEIRTRKLISRAEVAERAGLSERTYADIERGSVNMRIETFLKLCQSLCITPNEVLTIEENEEDAEKLIMDNLRKCSETELNTACKLLNTYINSLHK